MQLTPVCWGLLILFLTLFFINSLISILYYGRLAFLKNGKTSFDNRLSLMMIIRNEERNLEQNLPIILNDTNNFSELIVVDDFSHDNSLMVLGSFKQQYGRLHFSALNQETRYSEKIARNIAIKATSENWVMMIPVLMTKSGENWPSLSSRGDDNSRDIYAGYVNVLSNRTLINHLYRSCFMLQQLKSFGAILSGTPYVINEDNVAFKKGNYFEFGGFREKLVNPYAHFELIINSFITKKSTEIFLSKDHAIFKDEVIRRESFSDLFKKEMSIKSHLSLWKRAVLSFLQWCYLLFVPVMIIASIVIANIWPVILIMTSVLIAMHSFFVKRILRRLGEDKLFLTSLLIAAILPYFLKVYRIGNISPYRKQRWRRKI